MDWRDTLRSVLQGVTLPPAIPQNFQQPQASIPLPPLGNFGMQALQLAGLPAALTGRRNVMPAPFAPSAPSGGGLPVGGGDGTSLPNPLQDSLDELAGQGVPVVPGRDSRIPDPYGGDSSGVMGDSAPPPLTYPTPEYPFFDPPGAVPVPPPHVPQYPDASGNIPPAEPTPEAPWAPYVPGQTTTEHSDILNPGTTVGDFLSPPPAAGGGGSSATDWLTNPIGSAADALGGLFGGGGYDWSANPDYGQYNPRWTGNPLDTPLNLTDVPDPFNFWSLDPAQREQLRQLGYWKDA